MMVFDGTAAEKTPLFFSGEWTFMFSQVNVKLRPGLDGSEFVPRFISV